MITLEQAKRLKEAGWKGNGDFVINIDMNCLCLKRHINMAYLHCFIDAPDEKEMMEWLYEKEYEMTMFKGGLCLWEKGEDEDPITVKGDITEALVQACCRVLKEAR